MPNPSTPESPLPVRTLSRHLGDWISRLGRVWVEGQITELVRRPGQARCYLVLRDTAADVSVPMSVSRHLLDACAPPVADGQQVVVLVKPEWYFNRGQLSLAVHEIRPVGAGALLARLEQLKALLAAEGLFDLDRKKPLPFLPRCVGLVTGRESAAKRDVEENARRRWPGVRISVVECAVQGVGAVAAMTTAIHQLDRDPEVDVIVVARGGGSVEDLLPFSDESLCRAVAACFTPVVSAIGHEQDTPLLDFVADVRASTPTDAGKLVVPDVGEEQERVLRSRRAIWRCLHAHVDREQARLDGLRSRPCLAAPETLVSGRATELAQAVTRSAYALRRLLDDEGREVAGLRAQVTALSPQGTLDRGYAVVQRADGAVVRDASAVEPDEELRVRLAQGSITVSNRAGR